MTQKVLKNEIVDQIKNDALLFGKVAAALNIKPVSLPYLLNNNNIKLTQVSVVNILRKHFNVSQDSELFQKKQEPVAA